MVRFCLWLKHIESFSHVPVLKSKYLGRVNARRTEYQLSVAVHMNPFLFENGDFFPLVWPNRPHA